MFDFNLSALVLGVLLLAGYILFIRLQQTTFALQLSLCVNDSTTDVFDATGRTLVRLCNKVIYKRRNGKLELMAVGQSIGELRLLSPEEARSLEEIDLLRDADRIEKDPDFRTTWGMFIYFCCERARRQLGKSRFRHLNVRVTAKTSRLCTNRAIQEEIEAKDFRSFGTFRIVDSAVS